MLVKETKVLICLKIQIYKKNSQLFTVDYFLFDYLVKSKDKV